jgi:hypothetical protein
VIFKKVKTYRREVSKKIRYDLLFYVIFSLDLDWNHLVLEIDIF